MSMSDRLHYHQHHRTHQKHLQGYQNYQHQARKKQHCCQIKIKDLTKPLSSTLKTKLMVKKKVTTCDTDEMEESILCACVCARVRLCVCLRE